MTEKEIFSGCLKLGMTPAGAAGCTANILAESAGRPNNVEDRSGIADAVYTQRVDDGSYLGFETDRYGFGLCQWTLPSRKKALLEYARGHGVSIADANMQFQFMAREMRASYTYVWSVLTTATDPYKAGYAMCKFYEIPANTEASSRRRGENAKEILARFASAADTAPAVSVPDTAAPRSEFWPPRMLCKGMNGPDVTVLQAILVARGYTVTAVNGIFDDSTDKAARKFQTAEQLAVDGVVGPKTWGKLLTNE